MNYTNNEIRTDEITLPISMWMHIAVTISESEFKMYIDGELKSKEKSIGTV